MKRKIAIVAYPLGRTGSSAMMGLLKVGGFDVGKKQHLSDPSKMNPKGFFELKNFGLFMNKVFGEYYGIDLSVVPNIELLETISTKYYKQFEVMLNAEFSFPAAIKSQRFLTVPLFYKLIDKYDIRIISMHRNSKHHALSIQKMWRGSKRNRERNDSISVITEHIKNWSKFVGLIKSQFPIKQINVDFEDLIDDPIATAVRIFGFIGVPCPEHKSIFTWVDKKLVNRKNIV